MDNREFLDKNCKQANRIPKPRFHPLRPKRLPKHNNRGRKGRNNNPRHLQKRHSVRFQRHPQTQNPVYPLMQTLSNPNNQPKRRAFLLVFAIRKVAALPFPAGPPAAKFLWRNSQRHQFPGESDLGLPGRHGQGFQRDQSVGGAGGRSSRQESCRLARHGLLGHGGFDGAGGK